MDKEIIIALIVCFIICFISILVYFYNRNQINGKYELDRFKAKKKSDILNDSLKLQNKQ